MCVSLWIHTYLLVCVCVGVYLHVGWKGQTSWTTEAGSAQFNTNNVKFLFCHRNKDGDSPLSFMWPSNSLMVQSFPIFGTSLVKTSVKQYLTILTFNIFTYALMSFSVDIYLYNVCLIIIFKCYPSKHQLIHVYYL